MPALTLKNIPKPLYGELKQVAKVHHRSLSSEILDCLERTLLCAPISTEERLERARAIRAKTARHPVSERELNQARLAGRL